jgi:hypothetical protein
MLIGYLAIKLKTAESARKICRMRIPTESRAYAGIQVWAIYLISLYFSFDIIDSLFDNNRLAIQLILRWLCIKPETSLLHKP